MEKPGLQVQCPYCGASVPIDLTGQAWAQAVQKVLAVPLVTRLGQASTGVRWAQVASLRGGWFAKAVGIWNRTVGVLRHPGRDTVVMHSEWPCGSTECGAAFDVLVLVTPGSSYEAFWPHLTGVLDGQRRFTAWPAKMWFEETLDALRLPRLAEAALLLVGTAALAALSVALGEWPVGGVPQAWAEAIVLRAGCGLLIAAMILALRVLAEHLRQARDGFQDLLTIANPDGFTFWHNYMMARLTGVRLARPADPRHPPDPGARGRPRLAISQASALGGLPSVLISFSVWLIFYRPSISATWPAALTELLFWLFAAYVTGVTSWVSLNFSFFMTENAALIPMRLTPLNNFANVAPINRMIRLALMAFIPVALVPLFLSGAMFVLQTQATVLQLWLLPWLVWALGFAFVLVGVADKVSLLFGAVYVALIFVLTSLNPRLAAETEAARALQVVFGLFFAILLMYQMRRSSGLIEAVLAKNKNDVVRSLDKHLVALTNELRAVDQAVAADRPMGKENVLQEIERTLKVRDIAMAARTSVFNVSAAAGVLSPLFSSLVIPIALESLISVIATVFHF